MFDQICEISLDLIVVSDVVLLCTTVAGGSADVSVCAQRSAREVRYCAGSESR